MSTTVADGRTGLLFSAGDSAMLAMQIERILSDDRLAQDLGRGARERAQQRHEPSKIVRHLLSCYRTLAVAGNSCSHGLSIKNCITRAATIDKPYL